ncbi:DUF2268 domain-containing putative Zn-dependent protease [Bacillus sp. ISL-55]|uniref:DUF2268 domain-containing putative Zn-dependent protease n=1 Tax=Bacillus sp. ISL-55 TaxID=2819134 RepID=UPI001BEA77D9|nr:DUF2268 domain-containing putative Zn-dependent protease [Bacillus sp. ISL-55]MBT2691775.1 hypothetical protein [Bacillus sp. ISL-55]
MDKVEVLNLVPKFLSFYNLANNPGVDVEKRWALWEEHYNFAAVPPGEEGRMIARNLLGAAWESYANHLSFIEKWEPNLEIVRDFLSKVKALLGYDQPIDFVVVYFVGGFENNPFVAPFDVERLALCLPIENGDSEIILAHELTHIVHAQTANLTAEWERTIASTILQEGLATRVSQFLIPGHPDELYIEHKKGWLQSCKEDRAEIIPGIFPFFDDSSSEAVTKFTFGNGTANHDREAYYVGWELVHFLLAQGVTFKEMASVQEKDIPGYLRDIFSKNVDVSLNLRV